MPLNYNMFSQTVTHLLPFLIFLLHFASIQPDNIISHTAIRKVKQFKDFTSFFKEI